MNEFPGLGFLNTPPFSRTHPKLGCIPSIFDGIILPFMALLGIIIHLNYAYFTTTYMDLPFVSGSCSSLHPLLKMYHQASQLLIWVCHICSLSSKDMVKQVLDEPPPLLTIWQQFGQMIGLVIMSIYIGHSPLSTG